MKFFVNKQHKIRFWFSLISSSLLLCILCRMGALTQEILVFGCQ